MHKFDKTLESFEDVCFLLSHFYSHPVGFLPRCADQVPMTMNQAGGGGGLGLPRYATLCARYLISYNGFVQQCFTVLHLATLGRLKNKEKTIKV